MALKDCKECKKPVSEWAAKCPHCGVKNPTVGAKETAIGVAVLVAIVAGISMCSSEPETITKTQEASATAIEKSKVEDASAELAKALCTANDEAQIKEAVLKKMKSGEELSVVVLYSLDTPQVHVDKRLYDQLPFKSQVGLTSEFTIWSLCYAKNKSENGLVGVINARERDFMAFHDIDGLRFK